MRKGVFTATILSGQTISDEIDLRGFVLTGMFIPAAFTGTAITFLAATESGGTFVQVQAGAGSAVSKTVSTSKYIAIDPKDFYGIRFLKIVSGSAEGADRAVSLVGSLE